MLCKRPKPFNYPHSNQPTGCSDRSNYEYYIVKTNTTYRIMLGQGQPQLLLVKK